MAGDILDAVYGCLMGGAIGDALGAPVEGWWYTDIREKYGKVESFMPYGSRGPGMVTDDTTLRHYMCLAIVEKGGRITPDDFAAMWLSRLNADRLWVNEKMVLGKLEQGVNPWETGRGQLPAGCATMAISPIGIINAGNPSQAYQDGFNIASVNVDNENRDAAATLAAGVAAAFLPAASPGSVIDTMLEQSSFVVRRAMVRAMDLARESSSVDDFTEKFYAKMLDWTFPNRRWRKDRPGSCSSIEILPAACGILHLCDGDVNRCLIEGASFGRDCDTIANVVGGLAGALQGAGAIRAEWIGASEKANQEFFDELEGEGAPNFHGMAVRLVEALKKEKEAAGKRAASLEALGV